MKKVFVAIIAVFMFSFITSCDTDKDEIIKNNEIKFEKQAVNPENDGGGDNSDDEDGS